MSMVKELEEEIKKGMLGFLRFTRNLHRFSVRERYEQTKLVHEHMDEKSRDLQKTISTIQVPKLPEKSEYFTCPHMFLRLEFDAEEKTAFLTAFKARIAEKLAEVSYC